MTSLKTKHISNENVGRKTVLFDLVDHHDFCQIAVSVGLEYMTFYSHAGQVVRPIEPLQFGGGMDESVLKKDYIPYFFGAKQKGVIVSLVGGHLTSKSMFRVRVLHAFKPYTPEELGAKVYSYLEKHVKVTTGATTMWALINADELNLYQKLGFKEYKENRVGLIYVQKSI